MKDKKDMYLWLQVGEDVTDQDIRSALYDKGITRCILNPLPEYNWSDFRREAAKDILCAMIEARKPATFQPILIEGALMYTNALIGKLKQE